MKEPIQLIKKPDQTEEENKIFEQLRGRQFIAIFWDEDNVGYHGTTKNRREAYFEVMKMADHLLNGIDFEDGVEL